MLNSKSNKYKKSTEKLEEEKVKFKAISSVCVYIKNYYYYYNSKKNAFLKKCNTKFCE